MRADTGAEPATHHPDHPKGTRHARRLLGLNPPPTTPTTRKEPAMRADTWG